MINYVLLYKIKKRVKNILKKEIAEEQLATTEKTCMGCICDDISWGIYYLLKDDAALPKTEKKKT